MKKEKKLKKYNVKFYVWSDIEIEVDAEDKEKAKEKAIKKAIEEEPLVSWLVDEEQDVKIEEMIA